MISTYSRTKIAMSTLFTITVLVDPSGPGPLEVLEHAFRTVEDVERRFSRFLENSELSALNRLGRLENASSDLMFLLSKALFYAELTGGRYTPCILPVLRLYEEMGDVVDSRELERALSLADYRTLRLRPEERVVELAVPGTKVDLSSIAKGYAVDKAAEELRRLGVKGAVVNGGGDVYALGTRGEEPWLVGVRDPFSGGIRMVLALKDKAVATSGTYERFLDSKCSVPHVVDGKTGKPVRDVVSATVVTDSATDADALATVLLILGKEGLELLEERGLGEGYIVTAKGEELMSKGFKDLIARL